MEVQYLKKDKLLVFKMTEELDHHVVEKIRRRADYEIERYLPRKVIFDFNQVSFMDSAGIGLILGRYKNVSILGGNLELIHVNEQVAKVLKMSGISKLIKMNEEGCA